MTTAAAISPRSPAVTSRIGGASRPHALAKLDGRRREAKYLRRIEGELIAHLGGPERVSVAQRLLVERVAVDLLRLELLDAEMAARTVSAHDARVAHALRNSVRLALRDLGLRPQPPPVRTLEDIHRDIEARKAARGEVSA